MTDEEREIAGRQAALWQPSLGSSHIVGFGSALDSSGSWRLAVPDAEDEVVDRRIFDYDLEGWADAICTEVH
jgi:hypothetical protein